jgi:dolichyl-phosphate beta-glucosyltransferase
MALSLSVVVPVLNEERLEHFLAAIRARLDTESISYEIVVVSDGGAAAMAEERTRTIVGPHRGKGRAVREGLLAAKGAAVIVIDADLDVLIPHLPAFASLILRDGYDVAIAERTPDWHARKPLRFFLSYGLYAAQRLFVFNSRRFRDTQCGLKAFRGGAARTIAEMQQVDGGMYDIEYLYIARRKAMRIAQVDVGAVAESRPSRIRIWKCLRQDPVDLLRIKWRGITRRY